MTTHAPPEDFVSWLNGQNVNARALVSGTNLFACAPFNPGNGQPTLASKVIFIWGQPGGRPMPYIGGAATGSLFYARLQARVRGDPGTKQEARATCRALMHLVHKANRTAASPPYISVLVNESEPIELGIQDSGSFEYGFNIDTTFSE